MTRWTALLAILLPLASTSATLKPGYVACSTENGVSEFVHAAVTDDKRGMMYLLGQECVVTAGLAKFPISVLDAESKAVKIRVYTDRDTMEIWTSPEAVQK